MSDSSELEAVATEANNKLGEALQKANHADDVPLVIERALRNVEDAHTDLARVLPEFSDPDDGGDDD